MRKIIRILILLILSLLLCSCWDFKDINEKIIMVSIGIDYNNTIRNYNIFGEANNFTVSQPEQGLKLDIFNFSGHGETIEDAILDVQSSLPMKEFLGGVEVVIFGKTLAEKSIEPYVNRIDSLIDYRKTLLTVVSKDPPQQLLTHKINKAAATGSAIRETLEYFDATGKTISTSFVDVISSVHLGNVGYFLPYIGLQDNDVRYLGLAVMKDSKLIDIIDIKYTDGIVYLLSDNPKPIKTIKGLKKPNNIYSFDTTLKKRKIKVEWIDNTPVINVNLDINLELQYQYYTEPISEKDMKELEDSLSQEIQKDMELIVARSQEEYQCDMFNFVKYFRADCPKAYRSIDWQEVYPTSKINIVVATKIINLKLYDPSAKTLKEDKK